MEDFEYLMQKSNETGVKVLMDFVPNHSSDENQKMNGLTSRFTASTHTLIITFGPGKVDPNNSSMMVPP